MSARVFKPIPFADIPKIRSSPSLDGAGFVYKGFAKVRRSLFGTAAAEPGELTRFVDDELAKLASDQCDKWNFDFFTCKPKDGRYEWHTATPPKASAPTTPKKHRPFDVHQEFGNELLYPPIASSSLTALDEETLPELSDIPIRPDVHKKQSLITDFMQTRKRCEEPSLKKKLKCTTTPKPKKLARMFLADSRS